MARLSCFVVLLATVAIVSATNWAGTWTANNRYGGVMYSCVRGERWYATFSNGRIINGGETVEGNWWEGGRGNRNYLQGSFRITLSADGQRFDGLWNRLETEHSQRWHENRLGAPHPDTPTSEQCVAPGETRRPDSTRSAAITWGKSTEASTRRSGSWRDGRWMTARASTATATPTTASRALTFSALPARTRCADGSGWAVWRARTSRRRARRCSPARPSRRSARTARRWGLDSSRVTADRLPLRALERALRCWWRWSVPSSCLHSKVDAVL